MLCITKLKKNCQTKISRNFFQYETKKRKKKQTFLIKKKMSWHALTLCKVFIFTHTHTHTLAHSS